MNRITAVSFFLMSSLNITAQETGSVIDSTEQRQLSNNRFRIGRNIVPAMFIAYGAASFSIPKLRYYDASTKEEVLFHKPAQNKLDNYTQYLPAAMVYGLDAIGVKAKHDFRDRTIILLSSQMIAGAVVMPGKYLIGKERPDGSNNLSFPSGHAATAFATAHFMYREYRETNFWLSIAGYPFAAFTGAYRIINNKHFVSDVVAGAGIGILSTDVAYWLLPKINKLFKKGKGNQGVSFAPFYQQQGMGISMVKLF